MSTPYQSIHVYYLQKIELAKKVFDTINIIVSSKILPDEKHIDHYHFSSEVYLPGAVTVGSATTEIAIPDSSIIYIDTNDSQKTKLPLFAQDTSYVNHRIYAHKFLRSKSYESPEEALKALTYAEKNLIDKFSKAYKDNMGDILVDPIQKHVTKDIDIFAYARLVQKNGENKVRLCYYLPGRNYENITREFTLGASRINAYKTPYCACRCLSNGKQYFISYVDESLKEHFNVKELQNKYEQRLNADLETVRVAYDESVAKIKKEYTKQETVILRTGNGVQEKVLLSRVFSYDSISDTWKGSCNAYFFSYTIDKLLKKSGNKDIAGWQCPNQSFSSLHRVFEYVTEDKPTLLEAEQELEKNTQLFVSTLSQMYASIVEEQGR